TIAYVMLPSSILILPRARHSRPEPARSSSLSLVDSTPQIGAYGTAPAVPAGAGAGSGVAAAASAGRHAATAVAGHGSSMADAATDPYGFSFWSTPQSQGNGAQAGAAPAAGGSGGWSGQDQSWHSA